MNVVVRICWSSAEVHKPASQAVEHFVAFFTSEAERIRDLPGFGRLSIGFEIMHPGFGPPRRPSGYYHKATDTFYASTALEYAGWLSESWGDRVAAVAEGTRLAIGAIHRTRIANEDRAALLDAAGGAALKATESRPPTLAPLGQPPVSHTSGRPQAEVPATATKRMFKVYRHQEGAIEYREAWFTDEGVTEHNGVCGDEGETIEHTAGSDQQRARLLTALKKRGRVEGFRAVPLSRHRAIVVERQIAGGFGTPDDLNVRHRLESFLDDRLGWLGLGHCDGGSTGSGTMEAFCVVVNVKTALAALRNELDNSPFRDFTVRRWSER